MFPFWFPVPESRRVKTFTSATFADIAKTIAEYFDVGNELSGTSFLEEILS